MLYVVCVSFYALMVLETYVAIFEMMLIIKTFNAKINGVYLVQDSIMFALKYTFAFIAI